MNAQGHSVINGTEIVSGYNIIPTGTVQCIDTGKSGGHPLFACCSQDGYGKRLRDFLKQIRYGCQVGINIGLMEGEIQFSVTNGRRYFTMSSKMLSCKRYLSLGRRACTNNKLGCNQRWCVVNEKDFTLEAALEKETKLIFYQKQRAVCCEFISLVSQNPCIQRGRIGSGRKKFYFDFNIE